MSSQELRFAIETAGLCPQADSKDVFGEGRSGVDVLQELVDKVHKEVSERT